VPHGSLSSPHGRATDRGGTELMWTLLWLAIVVGTILVVVAFIRLARGPRR